MNGFPFASENHFHFLLHFDISSFYLGGNSGGQGGDQDSNLERDGSQIRGDDKTKMMILIILKSSAGACERSSPSSPRPARSRQRESRCAVGRGQEAGDQVLVDEDYDCDDGWNDECIGLDEDGPSDHDGQVRVGRG